MARLVLTLPEPRASEVAGLLAQRGHEALPLGFSALESLADAPAARRLAAGFDGFERVVLVSPTAVACFAQALPCGWPAGLAPAVVGPGSLAALAGQGVDRHPGLLVPPGPDFDAEALLALPAFAAPLDCRVLVVRAEGGNPRIERELAARGARVEVFEAYRRRAIDPATADLQRLADWLAGHDAGQPCLVVTTVEAADRLAGLADAGPGLAGLRGAPALTIHARIADRLRALGWRSVTTIDPGFEALAAAIESDDGVARPSLRGGLE
jgi:uroporphyrinogen III methyltransferase/synthase